MNKKKESYPKSEIDAKKTNPCKSYIITVGHY